MPFTPFHLGPALLLGVLLCYWVDLPTILATSVLVDVRAVLVVYGPLSGPTHGILTTFVGGTVFALLIGGVALSLPASIQRFGSPFRLANTVSPGPIFTGAVLGVATHVILDATLYTDVQPFWPLQSNPFLLGQFAVPVVYGGCLVAGAVGLAGFVARKRERMLAR